MTSSVFLYQMATATSDSEWAKLKVSQGLLLDGYRDCDLTSAQDIYIELFECSGSQEPGSQRFPTSSGLWDLPLQTAPEAHVYGMLFLGVDYFHE